MKKYTEIQQCIYDLINLIIDNETEFSNWEDEFDMDFYEELKNNFKLFKEYPILIRFFKECCCEINYNIPTDDIFIEFSKIFKDEDFKKMVLDINLQKCFEEHYCNQNGTCLNEEFAKYFLESINKQFKLELPENYLDNLLGRKIDSSRCEAIVSAGNKCIEEFSKLKNWHFDILDTLKCKVDDLDICYSISQKEIFTFKDRLDNILLNGTNAQIEEINNIIAFEVMIDKIIDGDIDIKNDIVK